MDTKERLWRLLQNIPRGKVTTYGVLATILRTSPRAVGAMLHSNPCAPRIPCHRVVMSDGSLGGYAGGVEKKKRLLRSEGIRFSDKMDLRKYSFVPRL